MMTEATHSKCEKDVKICHDLRTNVILSDDDLCTEAKAQFNYHTEILNAMRLNARSVLNGDHLSPIGRHLFCITLEEQYATCKRVLNYIATHPELKTNAKPMPRPLMITGLPRTGSTLLYNLLACDPACRATLLSDIMQPIPPITRSDTAGQEKRQVAMRAFSEMLVSLGLTNYEKELYASHPQLAYEEDNYILYQVGTNWINYILKARDKTEFVQWFKDEPNKNYAYDYHQNFIELLNNVDAPRSHWLFKSPSHAIYLNIFIQHYPSTSLIVTHRKLDEALPSALRAMRAFSSVYLESESEDATNNLKSLDENSLDVLDFIVQKLIEVRRAHPDFPVLDIFYDELIAQPIDTVRRIYDHFGFVWSEEFESAMQTWLRENPQGKQGRNTYSLEQFGLTHEGIEHRFKEYINMFPQTQSLRETDPNIKKD